MVQAYWWYRLLGTGRAAATGDAMGIEGVPDPAGVGRAVGQVAVVVVRRQEDRVPVGGAAAVDLRRRVALAARGHLVGALAGYQAPVPEGIHPGPARCRAPAGDELLGEGRRRRGAPAAVTLVVRYILQPIRSCKLTS